MRRSILFLAVLLALTSVTAQAQYPFALELRGGAAFPTQDLGDAALKTGAGFDVSLSFLPLPHAGVYVGWDWFRFVTDKPFSGAKYDVEDTGYAFGVLFQHPLANFAGGWIRGGGLYDHIELENSAGSIIDSGHEFGWEAGGGLRFEVTPRFAVKPGVRYRTFSAELDVGQGNVPVDLTYLTAELGVSWSFGAPRFVTALRR